MKLSGIGTLADFIWFNGAAISPFMKRSIDIQNKKYKVEACVKTSGMVA